MRIVSDLFSQPIGPLYSICIPIVLHFQKIFRAKKNPKKSKGNAFLWSFLNDRWERPPSRRVQPSGTDEIWNISTDIQKNTHWKGEVASILWLSDIEAYAVLWEKAPI